jgi:glycosyltransferase involved in cell wall biosynthesis
MNRIDPCKGLLTCADILKAWDAQHPTDGLQIWFAGQGDFSVFEKMAGADLCTKRVRYLGTVTGTDRAPIMSEALAMLMPTNFVEPFGGAGIEGMLCGTPLIASDWGAFTETIREGENGYRCKVLADWIHAIERVGELDHTRIAMEARKRYTLEVCAEKYDRAFHQLSRLFIGKGWDDMGAFEKRDPGPTDPTESLHTQH